MNVFNHVWDNEKLYKINISFESSMEFNKTNQKKKQKTNQPASVPIPAPVMEMARKRKAGEDEYQSPALNIVEIFNNINIQEEVDFFF